MRLKKKICTLIFSSLTHLKPLWLFLYIDFCLPHSFSLLLMFVYNQSKKKTHPKIALKREPSVKLSTKSLKNMR